MKTLILMNLSLDLIRAVLIVMLNIKFVLILVL